MNGRSPGAEIARSPAAWERLAKNWLLEVIERSPLDEVDDLPLGWISHEAAPLIAEILGLLSDPGAARELRLSPAALERAASLAAERDPEALVKRLAGRVRGAPDAPDRGARPRAARAGPPRVHARCHPPCRGLRRRPGGRPQRALKPHRGSAPSPLPPRPSPLPDAVPAAPRAQDPALISTASSGRAAEPDGPLHARPFRSRRGRSDLQGLRRGCRHPDGQRGRRRPGQPALTRATAPSSSPWAASWL